MQEVLNALKKVRGYDVGKKISGRKRHIPVDTMRLFLKVVVHATDIAGALPKKPHRKAGFFW